MLYFKPNSPVYPLQIKQFILAKLADPNSHNSWKCMQSTMRRLFILSRKTKQTHTTYTAPNANIYDLPYWYVLVYMVYIFQRLCPNAALDPKYVT